MSRAPKSARRQVTQSLQEYARGIAGGLLFSLPLLYTMEVWWSGLFVRPMALIFCVFVTFALLLGYNRYAGMRRDASWAEVAIDSVEEMGLGIIIAAVILWLLGRITAELPLNDSLGKIVIEAMTVAIGVSVGTAQLGGGDEDDRNDTGTEGDEAQPEVHFGGQLVLSLCGAILFAINVAPTEEILIIAFETSSWKLLGLALISLALGALILFYSNFSGAQKFVRGNGLLTVLIGAVITYAVALLTSAIILWFFGRFEGLALITCLAQTVVLGLAATLGASAGRLLLQ
jgi:putative integral membrane protein (TIGR02587 family)